jgi:hypothetical protein
VAHMSASVQANQLLHAHSTPTSASLRIHEHLYTTMSLHLAADELPPPPPLPPLFRHLLSASCACLAVARVNPTPQKQHFSSARPLRFSRWCLVKLLLLEKVRPLQHESQQRRSSDVFWVLVFVCGLDGADRLDDC